LNGNGGGEGTAKKARASTKAKPKAPVKTEQVANVKAEESGEDDEEAVDVKDEDE